MQPTSIQPVRLAVKWLLGLAVGSILVAFAAPLFVESNKSYVWDAELEAFVIREGTFRFRHEGFSNTYIGAHGFAGVDNVNSSDSYALWGDSQVQGLCVNDRWKIANLASTREVGLLPIAKGGDDVVDWYSKIPLAESAFKVKGHFLLVTDLQDMYPNGSDFIAAPDYEIRTKTQTKTDPPRMNSLKANVDRFQLSFVLLAAKNLFFEPRSMQRRKLRFAVGPAPTKQIETIEHSITDVALSDTWKSLMPDLASRSSKPIVIVYCPTVPTIVNNHVSFKDPAENQFQLLSEAALEHGIDTIDLTDRMIESYQESAQFPHGFHNGKLGRGHLNPVGNQIIADAICDYISENR
ncbi:MAG: hypothetical protein AAFN77_23725 [Planctomycetota bacterium]